MAAHNADNSKDPQFGPDDQTLQEELAKYKKAIQEEFESTGGNTLTGGSLDPTENVEKYTRNFFRQNLAGAAAQIVWLSQNSTSDAVKLNASKLIIKEALEDARKEGDPMKELFEMLRAD